MEGYYFDYKTEEGNITVVYGNEGITNIFLPYDSFSQGEGLIYMENDNIKAYFDKYFSGEEDIAPSINIKVSDFQGKVFEVLRQTQKGSLLTYGEIARIINCSSPRAIGQALKKNPVPILIPCHRVVGRGWTGGFGGETKGVKMDFKRFLMRVEGIEGWQP